MNKKYNMVALLPMKGHSERVDNKNMKMFSGAPLYHAIMRVLIKSKYISQVIINTDSKIIENDAVENFGPFVHVHRRPEEICGDFVSMNEIIQYDISSDKGEHFLQTHSTNPNLSPETIDQAIEKYFSGLNQYDSLFSVTRIQSRFYNSRAKPINHNPKELIRTQDLEPIFEENSNFYIFSKKSFIRAGYKRIGLNPSIFEMNKLEAIDIDEYEDFILAELVYNWKYSK